LNIQIIPIITAKNGEVSVVKMLGHTSFPVGFSPKSKSIPLSQPLFKGSVISQSILRKMFRTIGFDIVGNIFQ